MGTAGRRRCCCEPSGPPVGGFCDDADAGISYRHVTNGTDIPQLIEFIQTEATYIPQYLSIVLPSSLDLHNIFRDGLSTPIFDDPVTLCASAPPPFVLRAAQCKSEVKYACWSPCPSGVRVRATYMPQESVCFNSLMAIWEFGWSNLLGEFTSTHAFPFGITMPGRIYTRVAIRVLARGLVQTDGSVLSAWVWFSRTNLGPAIDWPTLAAISGETPNLIPVIDAEADFLKGDLALPSRFWTGKFYAYPNSFYGAEVPNVGGPCAFGGDHVSYDSPYETYKGRRRCDGNVDDEVGPDPRCAPNLLGGPDNYWGDPRVPFGCTLDNEGFEGFTVQAGDADSAGPSPQDLTAIYLTDPDECAGISICGESCPLAPPGALNFGDDDVVVDALPKSMIITLPSEIDLAWASTSPCSFYGGAGANIPSPWDLHPSAVNPLVVSTSCAEGWMAVQRAGNVPAWSTFSAMSGDPWTTTGVMARARYYSDPPASQEAIELFCGMICLDPTSVARDDRLYQLFTACAAKLMAYGPAGPVPFIMFSAHLGPIIKASEWWTVAGSEPIATDLIRKFAMIDNPWGWLPNWKFEDFYALVIPTASQDCEYSFPPEVYQASHARYLYDIASLADYCITSGSFQRCADGENHRYGIVVEPSLDETTAADADAVMRYCCAGQPCDPL